MAYNINATDRVYDLICSKIRHKEWRPGDRIWTEQEFTANLGVSRVAVRQAVDKLVVLSVLRKRQGSGTYVHESDSVVLMNVPLSTLSTKDVLEIVNFRASFESNNVEQFVRNADAQDRQRLEACWQEMLHCDHTSNDFSDLDFKFHSIIAEGTKNAFIFKINEFISDSLINHQKMLHHAIGPEVAMEYHPLILKGVQENDAQLASLLMRRHMEAAAREIEKHAWSD